MMRGEIVRRWWWRRFGLIDCISPRIIRASMWAWGAIAGAPATTTTSRCDPVDLVRVVWHPMHLGVDAEVVLVLLVVMVVMLVLLLLMLLVLLELLGVMLMLLTPVSSPIGILVIVVRGGILVCSCWRGDLLLDLLVRVVPALLGVAVPLLPIVVPMTLASSPLLLLIPLVRHLLLLRVPVLSWVLGTIVWKVAGFEP